MVAGRLVRRARTAERPERAAREARTITIGAAPDHVERVWRERAAELLAGRPTDLPIRFVPAPGGRGTEVHAEVRPGRLFGKRAMGGGVDRALRHLKQIIEVGEIVHSDASIHRGRHPARPGRQGGSR